MKLLHRTYGASPLHLVAHLAALALAAYAVVQLAGIRRADNVLLWFAGAVIVHDFVLLPLYSAFDRAGRRLGGRSTVNALRVALGSSALLALVYSPSILGLNEPAYRSASGVSAGGDFGRWLLASAVLAAVSAAVLAGRAHRRPR